MMLCSRSNLFKGTVSVILNYLRFKEGYLRFPTEPLKPLTDQGSQTFPYVTTETIVILIFKILKVHTVRKRTLPTFKKYLNYSLSSVFSQRLKGYSCESAMSLFKWKVALNYANSPFKSKAGRLWEIVENLSHVEDLNYFRKKIKLP